MLVFCKVTGKLVLASDSRVIAKPIVLRRLFFCVLSNSKLERNTWQKKKMSPRQNIGGSWIRKQESAWQGKQECVTRKRRRAVERLNEKAFQIFFASSALVTTFTLTSVSGFHKRTTSTITKKTYSLSINLKCDFKRNMTSLASVHLTRNKDSRLGRQHVQMSERLQMVPENTRVR